MVNVVFMRISFDGKSEIIESVNVTIGEKLLKQISIDSEMIKPTDCLIVYNTVGIIFLLSN